MYKKSSGIIFGLILFVFLVAFGLNLHENFSKASPEISIHSLSPLGSKFGKVVAASCAYGVHGSADESTSCTTEINKCPGQSQCGGICQPTDPVYCSGICVGGITPGVRYVGHQIVINNIYYYSSSSGQPTPEYILGWCTQPLPANIQRIVQVERVSSDGTNTGNWTENYDTNKTTWSGQSTKTYPYTEYLRIRASYYDTISSTNINYGPWVQADAAILHPNYGLPCTKTDVCGVTTSGTYGVDGVCNAVEATYSSCDKTNICGQNFPGFQCPSGCTADSSFNNDSCITNFTPSTSQVNPNGSVEFTWSVDETVATTSCSFVDLTSPTPRPIPGLQNLNMITDRARITNIQASTRFCLICQFYDRVTGGYLGEAAKHQWVRVQRIGEN